MENNKAFTPSDVIFAFQKYIVIFIGKKYLELIKTGKNVISWEYKDVEKLLDSHFTRPDTLILEYNIPQDKTIDELKDFITSLGFKYSKDLQKFLDKKSEEERKRLERKKLNQYGLESIKGIVSSDFDEYSTLEICKKDGSDLGETESIKPEVVELFRQFGWDDWFVDDHGLQSSFQNIAASGNEDLEKYADQLRGIGLECEIEKDDEF